MSGVNESSDDHEETSISERDKITYQRHSSQQIHRLEEFFKKCPSPNEKQRVELSEDLGLEPKQVKFWFQNKKSLVKAYAEKANNNVLQSKNEKLHHENLIMKATLDNLLCQTCDIQEVDRQRNLIKLRAENDWLKAEYRRVWDMVAPRMGNPNKFLSPPFAFEKSEWISPCFDSQEQMGSSSVNVTDNTKSSYKVSNYEKEEMAKCLMLETIVTTIEELLELLKVNEPLWVKSYFDGRYFLDRDIYNKLYPKTNVSISFGAWIESSKDFAIVSMPATHLIEMFSDSKKWMDAFPTIVTKAKTIGTFDTESLGGSLHLMYAKLHIISPLVEPREYIFLRYIRKLDSNTWTIVDTSYNVFNRIQDASLASWKLPSGCKIQQMPDGKSEVTWIEHVKVDGNSFNDLLFKELIWNCQAFGAKRWLVTLKRMCNRFAFSTLFGTMTINQLEGVVDVQGSKKSLMDISQKMVKNFCEALSMPKIIDVDSPTQLRNNDIQISFRKYSDLVNPHGIIMCVSSTLWLPVFHKNLFDFFKYEKTRPLWDIMSSRTLFHEIAHIATGRDPENCITLLKSFSLEESNTVTLQESCFDPLGGLVIYAPIHMNLITSAIKGELLQHVSSSILPILPSSFVISGDGRPFVEEDGGASTSSDISASKRGSILTMVFQMLILDTPSNEIIDTMHSFVNNTIAKIKAALGCPNFN